MIELYCSVFTYLLVLEDFQQLALDPHIPEYITHTKLDPIYKDFELFESLGGIKLYYIVLSLDSLAYQAVISCFLNPAGSQEEPLHCQFYKYK